MALPFIRNTIELKLKEAASLLMDYQMGIADQFRSVDKVLDKQERKKVKELLDRLDKVWASEEEVLEDFENTVLQLQLKYYLASKKADAILAEEEEQKTTTFEGITITRYPLKYSQLTQSVGYDEEHEVMDIAFTSGGIYRYYNVPLSFYESVITRNNFKNFTTEISQFEVKKINEEEGEK